MDWIIIGLIAPFLWAITNFIDKFLLSKYFRSNIRALVLYSSFIGIPVAILIGFFKPSVLYLDYHIAFLIILNSFLLILYLFPYLKALSKADTSVVIPIFQMIPVFTFILGFVLLGETITLSQFLGSLIIILGAIGISINFKERVSHINLDVLFLQLLANLLIAINYSFFKFFSLQLDFWTVSFWQYIGFCIIGLFLFVFVPMFRADFIRSFKENRKAIIGLNAINEVLNIIGTIVFSYAILLAPMALVWTLNGFQPVFVFLMGLFMTLLFPKIIKEDIARNTIIRRVLFILLILVGTTLL